jgi:quinol monooxygenase YgiN
MAFIQIIEYQTDQPEAVQALADQMRSDSEAAGTAPRFTTLIRAKDRDRDNSYVTIVEFPTYADAQASNDDPSVQAFAAAMQKLSAAPPRFLNLDVVDRFPA